MRRQGHDGDVPPLFPFAFPNPSRNLHAVEIGDANIHQDGIVVAIFPQNKGVFAAVRELDLPADLR